jgi:hypothetical protein
MLFKYRADQRASQAEVPAGPLLLRCPWLPAPCLATVVSNLVAVLMSMYLGTEVASDPDLPFHHFVVLILVRQGLEFILNNT